MKKAYAKPTATKVDFEYKDNVTAESGGNTGTLGRPSHVEYCQYTSLTDCYHFYTSSDGCRNDPVSLNLYL